MNCRCSAGGRARVPARVGWLCGGENHRTVRLLPWDLEGECRAEARGPWSKYLRAEILKPSPIPWRLCALARANARRFSRQDAKCLNGNFTHGLRGEVSTGGNGENRDFALLNPSLLFPLAPVQVLSLVPIIRPGSGDAPFQKSLRGTTTAEVAGQRGPLAATKLPRFAYRESLVAYRSENRSAVRRYAICHMRYAFENLRATRRSRRFVNQLPSDSSRMARPSMRPARREPRSTSHICQPYLARNAT